MNTNPPIVTVPTHKGLEIFDVDIDCLKQETIASRLKHSGKVAGDYIVRYACTTIPNDLPIAKNGIESFLHSFDDHLEQGARSIGATVLEHTWGLVTRRSSNGFYYNPELHIFGIEDYLLAAKVKILSGKGLTTNHGALYNELEKTLYTTRKEQIATQGWTSDALRAAQFTIQRQNNTSSLILHDIEPRIIG